MEMREDDFIRQQKSSDVAEPEAEKALADDEWICDNC